MAQANKKDLGYLGEDFQFKLVHEFLSDNEFFSELHDLVTPNEFTNPYLKEIVCIIKDWYSEYGLLIDYSNLKTKIRSKYTDYMLDSYLAYCVAMTDSPRDIYGFTDGISGRYTSLVKASSPVTFKGFAEELHTKDTTLASVKRALLHLIAGYTESDRKLFAGNHDLSYASVLGARKCAGELIKAVTEASSVPVITKKSEAIKKLRASENAEALLRLWSLDVKTTALYNSLICSAYKTAADNVYSAPLIMI